MAWDLSRDFLGIQNNLKIRAESEEAGRSAERRLYSQAI